MVHPYSGIPKKKGREGRKEKKEKGKKRSKQAGEHLVTPYVLI